MQGNPVKCNFKCRTETRKCSESRADQKGDHVNENMKGKGSYQTNHVDIFTFLTVTNTVLQGIRRCFCSELVSLVKYVLPGNERLSLRGGLSLGIFSTSSDLSGNPFIPSLLSVFSLVPSRCSLSLSFSFSVLPPHLLFLTTSLPLTSKAKIRGDKNEVTLLNAGYINAQWGSAHLMSVNKSARTENRCWRDEWTGQQFEIESTDHLLIWYAKLLNGMFGR